MILKTKEELINFLKTKIEYDGSPSIKCPKCGKIIEEGYSWVDHKSTLCLNICHFWHIPQSWHSGLGGEIYDIIEGYIATGDKEEDAINLADEIYIHFYGDDLNSDGGG